MNKIVDHSSCFCHRSVCERQHSYSPVIQQSLRVKTIHVKDLFSDVFYQLSHLCGVGTALLLMHKVTAQNGIIENSQTFKLAILYTTNQHYA